jgi:HTH-type transcriptional regulator/antitoxin HigA
MTASPDPRKYGRLLARTLPKAINTEEENDRMLAIVNKLMSKGEDNLTPEEDTLLELLTTLIERFEEKAYTFHKSAPSDILKSLMEDRGIRQRDLLPIFGSRGIASEVANGKRCISKVQAKKLGEFFRVSPELFI